MLAISPVFNAHSRAILAQASALPVREATELLIACNNSMCDNIAQETSAPWHIDGSVLLCAYLSRNSMLDIDTCDRAVELFTRKIAWTMDVFTTQGRAAIPSRARDIMIVEFAEPANELVLIKALDSLRRLVANRMTLDCFATVSAVENMLVDLEVRP